MNRSTSTACRGRIWPFIIVAMLLGNATIVGVTIYLATSDKSFAVEPDYYNKAVKWDAHARRRDNAARLGWAIDAAVGPPAGPDARPTLMVGISTRDSSAALVPLDAAEITAEIFPRARSSQRQQLSLAPLTGGRYAAPFDATRPGQWEARLTIRRGPETLSVVRTVLVGPTSGSTNP